MLDIVVLMGRLVSDPEKIETQSGVVINNFTLAVNDYSGEASFIDCKSFDNKSLDYCHKGDTIAVVGRLHQRRYTTKDGANRSAIEVLVSNVEFVNLKEAPEGVEESVEEEPAPAKKPVAKTPYRK